MALPLIAAGIGALGAAAGAYISHRGAKDQRKTQIAEAKKTRDFQERMSSTAYTRAVRDLRTAGLNPILAATQGGASTPAGAQARIEDVVEPAVSTAKMMTMMKQELRNLRAIEERELSTAQNQRMQAIVAGSQKNVVDQQFWETKSRTALNKAQELLLKLQAPGAKNLANVEESDFGRLAAYIDRLLRMGTKGIALKGGRS